MNKPDANMIGVPNTHQLDALIFSSPANPWRDVMVAGKWMVQAHQHAGAEEIASQFGEAMRSLWAEN